MDAILLTKRQAALRLGVSERTIDNWRASGRLAAVKLSATITRFRPEALDALVGQCEEKTSELVSSST